MDGTNRNNGTKENYIKTWHGELQRTNRGDRLQVAGVGSLLNLFRNSWRGDSWVEQ